MSFSIPPYGSNIIEYMYNTTDHTGKKETIYISVSNEAEAEEPEQKPDRTTQSKSPKPSEYEPEQKKGS